MKHQNVDTLCAIAARLLQDATTLRELGCERVAVLLEQAERCLDSQVYDYGCRPPIRSDSESTTQH